MSIRDLPEHPGIFQESSTGYYFNMRDFRAFDITVPFVGGSTKQAQPVEGEFWLLKSWSVLLHPWPKLIPVTLTVELLSNGTVLADVPLFTVARPLAQPDDEDVRARLTAIEKRLDFLVSSLNLTEGIKPLRQIPNPEEQPNKLDNVLVRHGQRAWATVKGGMTRDLFPSPVERKTFVLHLCGLKKAPWK